MAFDVYSAVPVQFAVLHRLNVTVPLNVGLLAETVAESLGIQLWLETTDDVQEPNPPRMKSFSVAVTDVEARVSETSVAKHSPPRLISGELRLRPASKSSPCRYESFPLLSRNVHGEAVPSSGFTIPQAPSGPSVAP